MTKHLDNSLIYLIIFISFVSIGCSAPEPQANIEITRVPSTPVVELNEVEPTVTQEIATPTTTPLLPTATPEPMATLAKIAFTGGSDNKDIYIANEDGTNLEKLTDSPSQDMGATWSPDGTEIAFLSKHADKWGIYIINADGSNERQITEFGAYKDNLTWSPDGTQLAFNMLSGQSEQHEIYIINRDGSNLTRLTNNLVYDTHPTWSPDGSKIAFSSRLGVNNGIYIMNTDGSDVTQLASEGATDLAWSPDGSQIAFSQDFVIYLINVDGSNKQMIVEGLQPTWNSQGTHLAFIQKVDDPIDTWEVSYFFELAIIDLVTLEVDLLNITRRWNTMEPAWQPQPNQLPPLAHMNFPMPPPNLNEEINTMFDQSVLFLADHAVQYWNADTQQREMIVGPPNMHTTIDDLNGEGLLEEEVLDGVINLQVSDDGQIALATQVISLGPSKHRLVTIDLNTFQTNILADNLSCFIKADLAPDGNSVVYISKSLSEERTICKSATGAEYTSARSTRGAVYLIPTSGDTVAQSIAPCNDGPQTILPEGAEAGHPRGYCGDVVWSPDNTQFFWFDTNGIWSYHVDSEQITHITITESSGGEYKLYLNSLTWSPNGRFLSMLVWDSSWFNLHFYDQQTKTIIPSDLFYYHFLGWITEEDFLLLTSEPDSAFAPWTLQQWHISPDGVSLVKEFPVNEYISGVSVLENGRLLLPLYDPNNGMTETVYQNGLYEFDPITQQLEMKPNLPSWLGGMIAVSWHPNGEGLIAKAKTKETWQVVYVPFDGSPVVDLSRSFGLSAHDFYWLP